MVGRHFYTQGSSFLSEGMTLQRFFYIISKMPKRNGVQNIKAKKQKVEKVSVLEQLLNKPQAVDLTLENQDLLDLFGLFDVEASSSTSPIPATATRASATPAAATRASATPNSETSVCFNYKKHGNYRPTN
ncbi:uncharacterized protein LOC126891913 [Diabrotica virgifera virgifera]|uniref:Uncharacterized protein n=1 Tax=Diabrotica virgifera virgifera TaxID=50390 RepID=A0ABM5L450_DIAVI|nr:uncharacterized protein LOC126891913 [Diabrotica virgifera virgifera]